MANRLLLGNRSSGGYGLYISRPGTNVLTCDKKDLIFDSSSSSASAIHVIAGITIPSGDPGASTTWTSVGYIPMALVTRTSAATGGSSLGMGHTFSSIFSGGSLVYETGNDFIVSALTATGATIVTRNGADVDADKFFRLIVFRYPNPS